MAQRPIHYIRHKFEKDSVGNPGWKIIDYLYWCGKIDNAIQGNAEVDPVSEEDRIRLNKQAEKARFSPHCTKCVAAKMKWGRL